LLKLAWVLFSGKISSLENRRKKARQQYVQKRGEEFWTLPFKKKKKGKETKAESQKQILQGSKKNGGRK